MHLIVRKQGDNFILFKQYDHSVVSGTLASNVEKKPTPYESVLYAIENNDIGWKQLDHEILWDDEINEPHDFTNYPLTEKLYAYTYGIEQVVKEDVYAGYLCSYHLASFLKGKDDDESYTFYTEEVERQEKLKKSFNDEQLEHLDYNYSLLKMCDDLSLFVCLNEPGENVYPWFKNGFILNDQKVIPTWKNRTTLSLNPSPFAQPFNISIPYKVVSQDRQVLRTDTLELQIE